MLNTVSDRAGASGKFPSGKRLGTVYGCDHPCRECTGPSDRLYALGQTGTEQDTDADQSEASDPKSTTSKSVIGIPGIFWL